MNFEQNDSYNQKNVINQILLSLHNFISILASGHVCALTKMFQPNQTGLKFYNLSTGKGASVLDIIKAFEKVVGMKIPVEYTGRREGDVPAYYANSELAETELNWKATKNLDQMIQDVWRWQSENPQGYL